MHRLSGCFLMMMVVSGLSLLADYHLYAWLTLTLELLLTYALSSM